MTPSSPVDSIEKAIAYDPETGTLSWKEDRRAGACSARLNAKAGDQINGTCSQGYIQVGLSGRKYRGHQIAWALYHGEWPSQAIDHRNGVKTDNRISNLRLCNDAQNNMNKPRQANNTSGVRGVTRASNVNKWQAGIWVNKKRVHLGYFENLDDAKAAYVAAAKQYFGEFYHAG